MGGRVACFGEVLLRLSAPDSERLLQSPRLDARFGGAEANVAVSLARFGHQARLLTLLPDNALGRAARDALRGHGVDLSHVLVRPGRLGLYFLTPGAVRRPSEVLYDRADSLFARSAGALDFERALDGADWLHVSGVTPAVSAEAAATAERAAALARARGVKVSFDGNYRAKLWAAWGGDGPAVLRRLLAQADLLFGDERDIALALGARFDDPDLMTRRRLAAQAAFDAFPQLQRICATVRVEHAADRHDLSATLFARSGAAWTAPPLALEGIVDRIGAGDAFAAGVLHGLIEGMDELRALRFGLAAAALKHSIPGDFNPVEAADVEAALADDGLHVRR